MPSLPIVAITTTAGTGSETDGGAVITNPETDEKTTVFGIGTFPVLAVVDAELMTSVPGKFKAYQGFDDRFIEMAKLMGMEDASKSEDFITMLVKLQEDCDVADLKMSDYGITPDEFEKMAKNAMDTLGINFLNDPCQLSIEDCVAIYTESFK